MKVSRSLFNTVIAVTGFVLGQAVALAGGSSARSGLEQAQAAALQWRADAALVQVSTLSAAADGTADTWSFMFHSPAGNAAYRVDVTEDKVARTEEVSASFTDAVRADFIDSPQAMAEAQKNGLALKGRAMLMLHVMLQSTDQQGPYWNILGDPMSDDAGVIIDASTGKLLGRD